MEIIVIKDIVMKIIRKKWRGFLRMSHIMEKRNDSKVIFFTNEIVQKYADYHRELQAVIAIVGDYRTGIDIKDRRYHPRGIYKAEGGVIVDNKEIVIKRKDGVIWCYNDWNKKEMDAPKIVKEVVEEILVLKTQPKGNIVEVLLEYAEKNTDASREILKEKISRFASDPYGGDSLRGLFSL